MGFLYYNTQKGRLKATSHCDIWVLLNILLLALLFSAPVVAGERAAYDVGGRITALLSNAEDIPISTRVVAVLPNGKRVTLQAGRSEASRHGSGLAWSLEFELPDGGHGSIEIKSE